MNAVKFRLRTVTPDDAERLLSIYAPYVEETAISFEYAVPSVPEFRSRIEGIVQKYPYLAAEDETGRLLGYAYTHAFIAREAYSHCAETTIYVAKDLRRSGLGKALYGALEELSRSQGIYNLYACIGEPQDEEDEYLSYNSIRFHEHLGFRRIGVFNRCGWKFGRWYNMVWAEKLLDPPAVPRAFLSFPALDKARVSAILARHSTF